MKEFPTIEAFKAKLAEINGKTFRSVAGYGSYKCPIEKVLQELSFDDPSVGYNMYSYTENNMRMAGTMPEWAVKLRGRIDRKAGEENPDLALSWNRMTGDDVLAMLESAT